MCHEGKKSWIAWLRFLMERNRVEIFSQKPSLPASLWTGAWTKTKHHKPQTQTEMPQEKSCNIFLLRLKIQNLKNFLTKFFTEVWWFSMVGPIRIDAWNTHEHIYSCSHQLKIWAIFCRSLKPEAKKIDPGFKKPPSCFSLRGEAWCPILKGKQSIPFTWSTRKHPTGRVARMPEC